MIGGIGFKTARTEIIINRVLLVVDSRDLRMSGDELQKMEEILSRHLGVLSEDFQHKLSIVAEGQQMLAERLDRFEDRVEKRMDALENTIMNVDVKLTKKIDAVAADLTAHRADTESHRGYRVCEGK